MLAGASVLLTCHAAFAEPYFIFYCSSRSFLPFGAHKQAPLHMQDSCLGVGRRCWRPRTAAGRGSRGQWQQPKMKVTSQALSTPFMHALVWYKNKSVLVLSLHWHAEYGLAHPRFACLSRSRHTCAEKLFCVLAQAG